MNYIVDTDTIIYFLKGHANVVRHIASNPALELATTIINHAELLYGAFYSQKKKQNLAHIQGFLDKINILPFCKISSAIFAEHKALLKKEGKIIADLDLMIASIALCHRYTLVTNNTRHFDRIKQLKLANWA